MIQLLEVFWWQKFVKSTFSSYSWSISQRIIRQKGLKYIKCQYSWTVWFSVKTSDQRFYRCDIWCLNILTVYIYTVLGPSHANGVWWTINNNRPPCIWPTAYIIKRRFPFTFHFKAWTTEIPINIARNIGSIVKRTHRYYLSFSSDTQQSNTSERERNRNLTT